MTDKIKIERLENTWFLEWQPSHDIMHCEAHSSFDDITTRVTQILHTSYQTYEVGAED